MNVKSPFTQVALNRRAFLFLGAASGIGVIFSQVLSPSDLKIWSAVYSCATKDWSPSQKKPIAAINGVLSLIREDKRSELNLALKLLGIAPICYFLTGYFTPWDDSQKVEKVLERWRLSSNDSEKKLYSAFVSIINSAYYSQQSSWKAIGYPGPPEYSRIKGVL